MNLFLFFSCFVLILLVIFLTAVISKKNIDIQDSKKQLDYVNKLNGHYKEILRSHLEKEKFILTQK